jgi:hypothetical protein
LLLIIMTKHFFFTQGSNPVCVLLLSWSRQFLINVSFFFFYQLFSFQWWYYAALYFQNFLFFSMESTFGPPTVVRFLYSSPFSCIIMYSAYYIFKMHCMLFYYFDVDVNKNKINRKNEWEITRKIKFEG